MSIIHLYNLKTIDGLDNKTLLKHYFVLPWCYRMFFSKTVLENGLKTYYKFSAHEGSQSAISSSLILKKYLCFWQYKGSQSFWVTILSLTLWRQTLLQVWRSVVATVFPSVGVGRVPETWQFVSWQEGTGVPIHSTLLWVTVSTALRLTGGRVWQWYLRWKKWRRK